MTKKVKNEQNSERAKVSFWNNIKREFKVDKVGMISAWIAIGLIAFVFIAAIFIPEKNFVNVDIMNQYLAPFSSTVNEAGKNVLHILGTDDGGRDEFQLLIVAARNSLFIAIAFTILTTIISTVIGLISAYFGGAVDWSIMRLIEFLSLIPTMMAIMVVVTIVTHYNAVTFILIFTAFAWMGGVRFVRSIALPQARMDYVKASKLSGASPLRTMVSEILPNLSSLIISDLTLSLAGNIGMEVGLSYLGFGLPPTTPSLGTLLNLATDPNNMTDRLWVWLPAALLIVIFTLTIIFAGQTVRRAADQRQSLA
jgi:peptide/nickel transport system permease protein